MGIMVTWYADGVQSGAVDPFSQPVDWHGELTHGHLPENNNHGGSKFSGLPDPTSLLSGPPTNNVNIKDYVYSRGDLSLTGRAGRPPVVRAGKSLTFKNLDSIPGQAPRDAAYHTITACKQPCTGTTGIAYPLANAKVQFDSKQLGYGPAGFTAAANKQTWKTPKSLRAGTYTYFCRVHPFMRGSFRVIRPRVR
jgi:plastocyanin